MSIIHVIHRILAAHRVMFSKRIYVVEVKTKGKGHDERVELWGPQMNDEVTVHIFRKLAESMENDLLTPDNGRAVSSQPLNPN